MFLNTSAKMVEEPSIPNAIMMAIAEQAGELLSQLNIYENNFSLHSYKANFCKLKNNLEKVNYTGRDLEKYDLFLKFAGDSKHDMRAIIHRECGDKEFAAGDYRAALDDYSCSVAAAKTNSVVAVGYANRSATLYKLGLYQECVEDIDRAILNNYPNEKKEKLLARRDQAQKSVHSGQWHDTIPEIPETQRNAIFPCATDSIKVKKNKEFGRYIVATKDIQIGEIISVEKASYVSVLTWNRLNHCCECLKLCYNPIPCPTCTTAFFCCEECRERALNSHHKYMCPIIMSFLENAIEPLDVILIAIMIAIDAKNKQVNMYSVQENNDYSTVTVHNRRLNYGFLTSVLANYIFHLLKGHTDLFDNDEAFEENFKEVLLTQLETVPRIGTKITELKKKRTFYESVDVGFGVYRLFSVFNHSCSPNVLVTFYGSTVVTRAINTIKAGSQCFISYNGISYDKHSKAFRQEFLMTGYLFFCKCRACIEDWRSRHDCAENVSNLTSEEYNALFTSADVNLAKRLLPGCIAQLKDCEKSEPKGNAVALKGIILRCYKILGNQNYH